MKSFILIDMSSSMIPKWQETRNAVNAFAAEVAKTEPLRPLEVIGFASRPVAATIMFPLREPTAAGMFPPLNDDTLSPNGFTPLFDAIDQLDTKLKLSGLNRASILVITDGEENASRKTSGAQAKAIIESWKQREWDVTFMGADFNAFGQGTALGLGEKDILNATVGNLAAGAAANAMRSQAYASGARPADLAFSVEERAKAAGKA